MNSAIERLVSLRVSDVMNPLPLCLSASQPLRSAAALLDENEISGAPVVDDDGRCVGVLSARDIVRFEVHFRRKAETNGDIPVVEDWMTANVQTLAADELMTQAARLMRDRHIHRVVAVDSDHKPIGVVSALDITAATIKAIEE